MFNKKKFDSLLFGIYFHDFVESRDQGFQSSSAIGERKIFSVQPSELVKYSVNLAFRGSFIQGFHLCKNW